MRHSRVRQRVARLAATPFFLIVLVAPLFHLHDPAVARPGDGPAARAATTAPGGAGCLVCHWSENLEAPLALPAGIHTGLLPTSPVPRVPGRSDSSSVALPFSRAPPPLLPHLA